MLVYARTHTQTTWVLHVSPGVGQTPRELEESRSTKAQYTCRPYMCTKYFVTYHLPTHFLMHIQRRIHTSTHVQSAHNRNGEMATARHRSLVERCGRKALLETLHANKKTNKQTCQKKPIFMNLKK